MRNFITKHRSLIEVSCIVALVLLAISLRVLSTFHFDFTEDEIFALEFNQRDSITQLLKAPDYSHPPLWYVVMDPFVSLETSPFILQLIQILFFTICLGLSFCLLKKYSLKLKTLFFALLVFNPFLIHYTSQYRMYSSVLGIALVTYCLVLKIIERNQGRDTLVKKTELIGLVSLIATGLLLDYSFFWLALFFIILFLISWLRKNSLIWKQLLMAMVFSGLIDSWFLPFFKKNLFNAAGTNQWTPLVTVKNFILMIGDLLGFYNNSSLVIIFSIGIITVILFIGLLFGLDKKFLTYRQNFFLKNEVLALIFSFAIFIVLSLAFPHSFFYARVIFVLVIPCSFLLAETFSYCIGRKGIYLLLPMFYFGLILISLSDYFGVLSSLQITTQPNYYWDFQRSSIKSALNTQFPDGSCLLPSPVYTFSTVAFNNPRKDKLAILNRSFVKDVSRCTDIYYLEQTTELESLRVQELQAIQNSLLICHELKIYNTSTDEKLYRCL